MFDEEYFESDEGCPHCEHFSTCYRDCNNLRCQDGYIDEYEDDPMWFSPGDVTVCEECHGSGVVVWCPKCYEDPRVKSRVEPQQGAAADCSTALRNG